MKSGRDMNWIKQLLDVIDDSSPTQWIRDRMKYMYIFSQSRSLFQGIDDVALDIISSSAVLQLNEVNS